MWILSVIQENWKERKISFSKVFCLLSFPIHCYYYYLCVSFSIYHSHSHIHTQNITHDAILIVRILLKWVNWVSETGKCLDIHTLCKIYNIASKISRKKNALFEWRGGKKGQMNKDRVSMIECNVCGKYIDQKNILYYIHDIIMSLWNVCVCWSSIQSVVLNLHMRHNRS